MDLAPGRCPFDPCSVPSGPCASGLRATAERGYSLVMPTAAGDPRLGEVIKAYMETRGIATHEAMARILGVERSLVSKYVNGSRSCRDVTQLRQFAEAMGLSPEI